MILTGSGNQVSGTYGLCNGTAKISGQVQSSALDGTWTQACNSRSGRFHFVRSPDGKSFTGAWSYGNATPTTRWDGTHT